MAQSDDQNDKKSIRQKFLEYHEDNPHILDEILKRCREVKESGQDDYSISSIIERLRWYYDVEVKGDYEFAISNDLRAVYSRLVMNMYPDRYDGFFQTNERPAADDEPDGWIEELADDEREQRGLNRIHTDESVINNSSSPSPDSSSSTNDSTDSSDSSSSSDSSTDTGSSRVQF